MKIQQEYFVRRELPVDASYEESYWGVITDPDGNVRDRREERERYLQDIATELAFINGLPAGRMLDIGCGLGFLLSGVADDWERHGVEVSAFAARRATRYGQIHQGLLEEAGYPDRHFDLVVIYHVIEHVADPLALLKEIRRILKPDGWLILGTPDFDSGAARRYGANYRLLHDVTHISLFSNESMHRFLRDHGFRIEQVDYPYFATRYFNRNSLLALLDTSRVSPPFYGNFMTFYCRREALPALKERVQGTSAYLSRHGDTLLEFQQACAVRLACVLQDEGAPDVLGEGVLEPIARRLAARLAGIDRGCGTVAPCVRLSYGQGLQLRLEAPGYPSELHELACPEDYLLLTLLFEDIAERVAALRSGDSCRSEAHG